MTHVNVTINGRQYRMACEEGQEERLFNLAGTLDERISGLRGKFGQIGDQRLEVMAALIIVDEMIDMQTRMQALEDELDSLRHARVAQTERARATQTAVAAALNSAAERIEKTTQALNRSAGNGLAMG